MCWAPSCAAPFVPDALFAEVRSASPYAPLTREDFDAVVDFVATGGYALRAYDRYARLRKTEDGRFRLAHPRLAQEYRLNAGVIVEDPMVEIRLQGKGAGGRGRAQVGRAGGIFHRAVWRWATRSSSPAKCWFRGLRETGAYVTARRDPRRKFPAKLAASFRFRRFGASGVREMVSNPASWSSLPEPVQEWLKIQEWRSVIPKPGQLLIETFPRGNRHYLVCYPFEGRLAHQTLGMLLTRRLERGRHHPMGFVANEYALAVLGRQRYGRNRYGCAVRSGHAGGRSRQLAGRIQPLQTHLPQLRHHRRTDPAPLFPAKEKSGRQVTFSSDLIYDVLREHEPDHVLLRATYQDAGTGLLDIARLGDMLARVKKRLVTRRLERVSPLAVPALLEISREMVAGEVDEAILRDNEDALIRDAMRVD
jgi:ATP-dependent Lhr-like helicase